MKAGQMVYYLHTNQHGNQTKFAAQILSPEDDGIRIRVGKYDVDTKEVNTMETVVDEDKLLPRNIPCSYEGELAGES